ncbi:MAG: SURF1 family protein [Proteobacteria bacterium]|nr:SURF1 family protein [Pseudomonadota bacterium]
MLLPILISLGVWQLHRATAKQQLINQLAIRSAQAPQRLTNAESIPQYTPLQVPGHYDKDHIILLDNSIVNHQVGYDIVAPFLISGDNKILLVNLGWVSKQDYKRAKLNAFFQKNNPNMINGLVKYPEHQLVLAKTGPPQDWPYLVEDIRINTLSQILNRPLREFILLSTDASGFTHHWNIVTAISPQRHLGYAFQWFALAVTLLILYIKVNLVPHEKK